MASELSVKPQTPEFTISAGHSGLKCSRPYLGRLPDDPQCCSGHSSVSLESFGAPLLDGSRTSNSILPGGASPAAHLLGRASSGQLTQKPDFTVFVLWLVKFFPVRLP
jgi:hypothetical protein